MSLGCVHNDNMANVQRVPNKTQLRRYLSAGLTQQQIVDAWLEESGEKVSRSAIAMAIERYDLKSATPRPDYGDVIPWRLAPEHRFHTDARMLRLEGRRRAGGKLQEDQQRQLDQWKADLAEQKAVVRYDRDLEEGFNWVERLPKHGDDLIDRSNSDRRPPSGGGTKKIPASRRD